MKTIGTANDYFEQVVGYNLATYKAEPSNLPTAYNLAISLFHMHDWVWHTYSSTLGTGLQNARGYNVDVQANCASFKHMRDLANAAKHVSLSSASTQATQITDTTAIDSGWSVGSWGTGKWGRGSIIINDGGTKVDFEDAADKVHAYWKELLSSLGA